MAADPSPARRLVRVHGPGTNGPLTQIATVNPDDLRAAIEVVTLDVLLRFGRYLRNENDNVADVIGEILMAFCGIDRRPPPAGEQASGEAPELSQRAKYAQAGFRAGVEAAADCVVAGAKPEGTDIELRQQIAAEIRALPPASPSPTDAPFDMRAHLQRQREWSERTFGPGPRAKGVVDHIRKELREIEADPAALEEWIDVAVLALDGAWRSGASPDQIIAQLVGKQTKNEARKWPDWRTVPHDKAIEHERPPPASPSPTDALLPGLRHVKQNIPLLGRSAVEVCERAEDWLDAEIARLTRAAEGKGGDER